MPSVEGVGARRAALQMLDAVLRRGLTIEAAGQQVRGLVAARSCAGRGDHRGNPAATARPRRVDRQRDPPAPARRFEGADGAAPRARAEDRARHARPCAWSRRRCRWSTAARGGWFMACSAPCSAAACPRSRRRTFRRRSRIAGEGLGRGRRAGRAPPDRQAAATRPDLRRRCRARPRRYGGLSLAPSHVRVESSSVAELAGLRPGPLVGAGPVGLAPGAVDSRRTRKEVLDLCAAPGGKTMQLAAAGHEVTAVDSSKSRLARLQENLERTHLKRRARRRRCADLEAAARSSTRSCSTRPARRPARSAAIPRCSIARARRSSRPAPSCRPAARSRRAMAEARRRAGLFGLLARAARKARKSSRRSSTANREFRIDPPEAGELPDFVTPSPEGWVRILPACSKREGGLDGFFMARLVRAG